MRLQQFSFLFSLILFLFLIPNSVAQCPWNKWDPETGVQVLPENPIDSLECGVQRTEGENAGEIGSAWIEYGHNRSSLRCQVIDNNGEFRFHYDGLEVFGFNHHVEKVRICPATDGGWFIAWLDYRDETWIIFYTKIDADGQILWGHDEQGISTVEWFNNPSQFALVSDGDNGFITMFQVDPQGWSTNLLAMHVLANGSLDHEWDGLWINLFGMEMDIINDHPNAGFCIIPDGEGGAIVSASNTGLNGNPDLFIQRISDLGELVWNGGQPVCVCNDQSDQRPASLYPDGEGGVFALWVDDRNFWDNGLDLYAQRIDPDGNLLWGEGGMSVCENELDQSKFSADLLEAGRLAVICADTWEVQEGQRFFTQANIHVNCISGVDEIELEWRGNEGVVLDEDCFDFGSVDLKANAEVGVITAWTYETNFPAISVISQKLSSAGRVEWDGDGVSVSSQSCYNPKVFITANQTAVFDWYSSYPSGKIYQHLNLDGQKTLPVNGKPIKVKHLTERCNLQEIIRREGNEFIIAWYDMGSFQPCVTFARDEGNDVTFSGAPGGFYLTSILNGARDEFKVAHDGLGGVIAAWLGRTDLDIYRTWAQRLAPDGERMWGENGITVSDENTGFPKSIISDQHGGAFIFWENGSGEACRLYYQRVDADGVPLWESGRRVFQLEISQEFENAILDDEGAVMIVCTKEEGDWGTDLIAQRISTDGELLWGGNGRIICDNQGSQSWVKMTRCAQGAFLVWSDGRFSQNGQNRPDVFGQVMNFDGHRSWRDGDNGIAVNEWRSSPESVFIDHENNGWIIWEERPEGEKEIRFQKIGLSQNEPVLHFGERGLPLAENASFDNNVSAVHDGQNGMWAVWEDDRDNNEKDLYAMHVDPLGDRYSPWAESGLPICTENRQQIRPTLALADPSGDEGVIISWLDGRNMSPWEETTEIFCQRVADDFDLEVGDHVNQDLPTQFRIVSLYPNPFNSQSIINYSLPFKSSVSISIFDLSGRRIFLDQRSHKSEGHYNYVWQPESLPTGEYFLQLTAGDAVANGKFIYLK